MNPYRCEDCGLEVDYNSFENLSKNPAYENDDVFIIHLACISIVGDKVLERSGDLLLVRRDYKAIYE